MCVTLSHFGLGPFAEGAEPVPPEQPRDAPQELDRHHVAHAAALPVSGCRYKYVFITNTTFYKIYSLFPLIIGILPKNRRGTGPTEVLTGSVFKMECETKFNKNGKLKNVIFKLNSSLLEFPRSIVAQKFKTSLKSLYKSPLLKSTCRSS